MERVSIVVGDVTAEHQTQRTIQYSKMCLLHTHVCCTTRPNVSVSPFRHDDDDDNGTFVCVCLFSGGGDRRVNKSRGERCEDMATTS